MVQVAAGVVFLDEVGRVLLVRPTYVKRWLLPGGSVEAGESPYAAACREVEEELGFPAHVGRLLAVDWLPPAQSGRPDRLRMVFDGGMLGSDDTDRIDLPADELMDWAFCEPDEADTKMLAAGARRLAAALHARASGSVAYLEGGNSVVAGSAR